MVLLIDPPFSHLCNLLQIFQLALRPSHHTKYHWGMYSEGEGLSDFRMEIVFGTQSILGFHLHNQGIPRMTCCHPKLRTMRLVFSLDLENRMLVWTFHPMVPLVLAVLSILYAWMGLGRCFRGKFTLDRRPMLMKFPVAPQLMRAVVSMI